MAKRGPKEKITARVEAEILACLTVGASLQDAADCVGIAYMTLYAKRKKDEKFRNRLNKAIKQGKLKLIKKVGSAKPWQAAAFMLERKWWKEYGRKDKVHAEHTGKNGGPIKAEIDLKKLSVDELRQMRAMMAKAGGRIGETNDAIANN